MKALIKKLIPDTVIRKYHNWEEFNSLSPEGQAEVKKDNNEPLPADPGKKETVVAALDWILRAQKNSASHDGGIARDFSVKKGWATSYPETTGYIIPTLIDGGHYFGNKAYIDAAKTALDWCEKIQLESGAFQGGRIENDPVPVTFNTGQILIGLAAGVKEFDQYHTAMNKAAQWLVDTMDDDGAWRRFSTPFAEKGEKAYETHVSWGLLEAAKVSGNKDYGDAALKNIKWALTKQLENGWFKDCCLDQPDSPLTHTLGYVLRGIMEGYLYSKDEKLLQSALKTAGAFTTLVDDEGYLPGRWYRDWTPAVSWVCLTGAVQIAHSLLLIYKETGHEKYLKTALKLNKYVRRTIRLEGENDAMIGGVKGSYPIDGLYGRFEYLNWAAKFFIDSNMLEAEIMGEKLK
ncbi:MAG: hypothetical protein KDF58_07725 [Alphaproteobacteria bacterium]|nr:hypothetical protein [Alphaproteobacteria bacterium]HPF47145.1 hypothetical protein [Emcibacteraceae bacterium]